MCGICGIVSAKNDWPINDMLNTLVHRGPDMQKTWEEGLAKFGHARLSIIDLSEAGTQPMISPDGTIVMVYNGEIYNFHELREELERLGHAFNGHSDSEVLLHAFCEWGVHVFPLLNGMFAAAFWDRRVRKLVLVRDRFGIKPLYFAMAKNDDFFFASEIKAILAIDQSLKRLNPQAFLEYLFFQNPLGKSTFYQNIQYLLPGHYLEFDGKKLFFKEYWNPLRVSQVKDSEKVAVERIRDLLTQAVSSHLLSDVPVGLFLSGGIDSSALAILAGREIGKKLSSFSVEFDFNDNSELEKARKIAQKAGTNHHELRVESFDIVDKLRALTIAHDQPFGDAANLPIYMLAQAVKSSTTVILQGDGGDEIFGGYERYHYLAILKKLRKLIDVILLPSYYLNVSRVIPKYYRRWLEIACSPDEVKRYAILIGSDSNTFPMQIFSQEMRQVMAHCDPYARFREVHESLCSCQDEVRKAMLTDTMILLPDKFLEKVDKPTMANSIEVRVPFLDVRLTEYVLGLPSATKVNGFEKKRLLRKSLRGLLPDEILDAPKKGFGVPIVEWLKGPLSEHIRETITSSTVIKSGLFDAKILLQIVEKGLKGYPNESNLTWLLYRMADWMCAYRIA